MVGSATVVELCVRSRNKLSEPSLPDLICALHCLLQEGNAAAATGKKRAKVVANLPFNLTKSMLRRLLPLGDHISELYLMVQVHMCLPPLPHVSSTPAAAKTGKTLLHKCCCISRPDLSMNDWY